MQDMPVLTHRGGHIPSAYRLPVPVPVLGTENTELTKADAVSSHCEGFESRMEGVRCAGGP